MSLNVIKNFEDRFRPGLSKFTESTIINYILNYYI